MKHTYRKMILFMLTIFFLMGSCTAVSAVSLQKETLAYAGKIDPLDFGNHNDYDGGGGDFGGFGDGDFGGYGGYYGDSDYSGSLFGGNTVVILGVFAVIVVAAVVLGSFGKKKKGGVRQGSGQGQFVSVPDRTAEIASIIQERDPDFSASDFITFGKEVFVDIQDAWSARDLSSVRLVMHENLYNQTQKQVDEKIRLGLINHIENIAVSTAYLTAYKRDSQFEYATMCLSARFIDYEEEEKTGKVIRGDKTNRWEMRYLMKFMRATSVKTRKETDILKTHNCPNCGAPLKMESSGVCEYCGSVVTTGQYSWVLCDHASVRNDTVDEGVSV